MIITDAPGKPKATTPKSLKCIHCGCIHRLADLKTTANCPNCAAPGMVAVDTNESFDLQAHLDQRKDLMKLMASALGPGLPRRCEHPHSESGGQR